MLQLEAFDNTLDGWWFVDDVDAQRHCHLDSMPKFSQCVVAALVAVVAVVEQFLVAVKLQVVVAVSVVVVVELLSADQLWKLQSPVLEA